jgi:hypothetical protein
VSDDAGEPGADYADSALLIGAGPRLEEDDVELTIAGRPARVRVRGLSRQEVFDIQKIGDAGIAMVERKTLALAMLRPRMTEGQVREWQENAPAGEMERVTDAVERLSGVADGQAKAIYKGMDADPASEFRPLPSDEAG